MKGVSSTRAGHMKESGIHAGLSELKNEVSPCENRHLKLIE